jgi:hypothetical protein
MKTYIVYFNGIEVGLVKASSHNAAEKKAQAKLKECNAKNPPYLQLPETAASVAYTEI